MYFNVYNKRVLNAFPYPGLCTLVHLSVGTLCMAVIWGLGLRKAPKLRTTTVLQVLPLGALHLLGALRALAPWHRASELDAEDVALQHGVVARACHEASQWGLATELLCAAKRRCRDAV